MAGFENEELLRSSINNSSLLSSENSSNIISNFDQIALAPAVNAGVVQPVNAFVSISNSLAQVFGKPDLLPHMKDMQVAQADFLSLPWLVEGVSAGLGGLVPYLAAGKMTSGALRGIGAEMNTSAATARFLQNDATGQILGAAIYDGVRDPKSGETRLGNALGGAAAFGVFHLGSALKIPSNLPGANTLSAELIKRSVFGASGAAAQLIVSTETSSGKMPAWDDLSKAGLSGIVMNIVLPESQKFAGALIDTANKSVGIGVPIDRYLDSQLGGKPVQEFSADLAQIQDAFPWARIRTGGQVIDFDTELSGEGSSKFSLAQSAAQLKGILYTAKPSIGLDVMMNTGQLPALIPEMVPMAGAKGMQDPKWHKEGTAWQHSKMVVDKLAETGYSNDQTMMMSGLLHDIAKPKTQIIWPDGGISNKTHDTVGAPIAKDIALRLGVSQTVAEDIFGIVSQHERMHHVQKMSAAELRTILENPQIKDLIAFQYADSQGRANAAQSQTEFLQKKLNELIPPSAGAATAKT